jgi:hypothetical protein
MSDDGSTKDDVKLPDGEVGDKINKLFVEDGKDTSESIAVHPIQFRVNQFQASSSSPPWARSLPLMPRRLPNKLLALETSTVGKRQVVKC